MEYTWEVTGLKTKTEGSNVNAVVQTYWKKTGTDEAGNTGTFSGATPFTSVDVPEGEFVAFESLTEETVLGWIQAVVVDSYEEHVNGMIQRQIDEKSVTEAAMPWAPVEEAAPEEVAP